MNREYILSIINDLILTIGRENKLQPLFIKVLQRLMFHTNYPTGLILLDAQTDNEGTKATLVASIGDRALQRKINGVITIPAALLNEYKIENLPQDALINLLPATSRNYRGALRLSLNHYGIILLLSPEPPASNLPFAQIFQPVLAHLRQSIELCRQSERYQQSLLAARDEARAELAATHIAIEKERTLLRNIQAAIPDAVWTKDLNGTFLSCNQAFERLFGITEAELVGKNDYHFFTAERAEFFSQKDHEAIIAVDRHRGRQLAAPLPHHLACGSAPGGSRS